MVPTWKNIALSKVGNFGIFRWLDREFAIAAEMREKSKFQESLFLHDIDFLRRLPQLDRESAVVAPGRFFSCAFVKFLSRSNFALFESCGKVTFLFLDLNECESPEENPCSKHATCTNTIGSVTCQCKKETIFTNFYKEIFNKIPTF